MKFLDPHDKHGNIVKVSIIFFASVIIILLLNTHFH